MDYEVLRKQSIRGGMIKDFISIFEASMDTQNLMIMEMEKVEGFKDIDNSLFEMKADFSAYNTFFYLVDYVFEISLYEPKKFRNKTFKGFKIIQLMNLLKLKIKECLTNEKIFKKSDISNTENILFCFQHQRQIYEEILKLLHKFFVSEFEENRDITKSIIEEYYKEEGLNNG